MECEQMKRDVSNFNRLAPSGPFERLKVLTTPTIGNRTARKPYEELQILRHPAANQDRP
jgi:hypothetical protein